MMIGWHVVERITQGRIGRTLATCPLCSGKRRSVQHRRAKVLAVNLIEPDFAIYYCNHCAMSGHSRPDIPGRVVNHVELSRHRQEAERLTATDKKERSRRALALWNDAEPFHASPAETYLRETRGIGDWLDQFPHCGHVPISSPLPSREAILAVHDRAGTRHPQRYASRYSPHGTNN
jgi:hypothetical protein